MPIFDYVCPSCDTQKEAMVKNSIDIIECPKCSTQMTKQIASPAFVTKGEGFFGTGSCPKSKDGPKIPAEFSEMPDVELNRSLGLPDDHS